MISQYGRMVRDALPYGWSCNVMAENSTETLTRRVKLCFESAPDITGRKAYGSLYVERYSEPVEMMHATHGELCRMDGELVHELTIDD